MIGVRKLRVIGRLGSEGFGLEGIESGSSQGVGVREVRGVRGVGVEGVQIGGDRVGFGGVQVRGLGSGRSEGLGSKGLREFGSRVRLGLGNSEDWGVGSGGLRELGSGGWGLARKIEIRVVGVGGIGVREVEIG